MPTPSNALEWLLLVPVVAGTAFTVLTTVATLVHLRRLRTAPAVVLDTWPPVSVIKPVYGLERHLEPSLRSICEQDYPDYQVVFCVQRPDEPALPILRSLEQEFGPQRVVVVVANHTVGSNGKVNNLFGGLGGARHDRLVMVDSDVLVGPAYLKQMVATLEQPGVGAVCSLFEARRAETWYERLEALTINADFMPSVIFTHLTGAAGFCLGPSIAIRRSTLEEIGGLEGLADYLVEDYEIGRRVRETGKRMGVAPHLIQATVDLGSVGRWWSHQIYWDLNLRLANPGGFFGTVLVRSVPFAIAFAGLRLFDPLGLVVLAGAVGVRLVTSAITLGAGFRDRAGLAVLLWMPLRDVIGLTTWFLALLKRTVIWRDTEYRLTAGGKMVRRTPAPETTLVSIDEARSTR